jgi:hypothetical protein
MFVCVWVSCVFARSSWDVTATQRTAHVQSRPSSLCLETLLCELSQCISRLLAAVSTELCVSCRLILLNKLLEDGNVLYRKNRLKEAAHRYQYALKKFPAEDLGEHSATFKQLRVNFLLNQSRCKRKMNVSNVCDSFNHYTNRENALVLSVQIKFPPFQKSPLWLVTLLSLTVSLSFVGSDLFRSHLPLILHLV